MQPEQVDILIRNGEFVITMDPGRRIISDGAVAIDKGVIVAVGKTDDIVSRYTGTTVIDARDKVVMPGLIDAHAHPSQYLSKGIADDVDIVTWVYERMFPFESSTTPEEVYVCGLGAFVEMIRHGTTCHNNPGVPGTVAHVDAMARAMKDVGMRGIVARYTFDAEMPGFKVPGNLLLPTDEQVAMNEEVVRKWNGVENDLIRAWFGWRIPYNVTDRLILRSKELADKYGVGIHTHANITRDEEEIMTGKWGKRTLAHYTDLGIMGPNLFLAHMGWTSLPEVELLAEHDVKVCHCPTASMHGSYGCIAHGRFPEMIEAGVTVTIGHDSVSCGRTTDMFNVMFITATAHRDARMDPFVIGPHKALEMATVDAARALLWEDRIGSLEPGKRADVITVDLNQPEWWPMWDIVANLIYGADGSHVDNVIVDGRIVMRDRKIVTIDEEELLAEVKRVSARIKERIGVTVPVKWPVE